mmetsp:Transcript_4178/g.10880  ORF Transcript_4178/g.10880 Transcript_4178/m.10880 type:complete len:254 (+) Transcript_4178:749-1510(+)
MGKMTSAGGMRGRSTVPPLSSSVTAATVRSATTTPSPPIHLTSARVRALLFSASVVVQHPSYARASPLLASASPRPACTPRTMAAGHALAAHFSSPVAASMPTIVATIAPAAATSARFKPCAIATAAMAFIGCTASGLPMTRPETTECTPVTKSVTVGLMAAVMAIPIKSGMNVPRSPSAPAASVGHQQHPLSFPIARSYQHLCAPLRSCSRVSSSRRSMHADNNLAWGESSGSSSASTTTQAGAGAGTPPPV